MNRKQLLETLKEEGYSDDKPTLESVKAFVESQNIWLKDADGAVDIAEAWNTKSEITFKDPEEKPSTKAASKDAVKAAAGRLAKAIEPDANKSFAIGASKMVHRAYDAKAAMGKTTFPSADIAEFAGACMRVGIAKSFGQEYSQRERDDDIIKTATTLDNTNVGALIPVEYIARMVYNTEKVGVARSIVNVQPMSRDTQTVPRRTGIGAMSWVNEAGTIPETEQSFDTINLSAKKMGRILKISSEAFEDVAVGFAETAASAISESRDIALDTALVLGDGSSTYGGITGLKNAGSTVVTSNNASGAAWSNTVIGDYLACMASIKNADLSRCYWLMCREHYITRCMALDKAASQYREIIGPPPAGFDGWFLDRPVRFLPSITGMPTASAAATRFAYFGDFMGGITMGDRRDLGIDFSKEAYWATDVIAWRATTRATMVIHGSGRPDVNSNIACLTTT